jgi:hypothetical protein
VAKSDYTIEPDGSITFHGDVSEKVRLQAYEEAARQRAAATNVPPEEVEALETAARESADLVTEREKATEVAK